MLLSRFELVQLVRSSFCAIDLLLHLLCVMSMVVIYLVAQARIRLASALRRRVLSARVLDNIRLRLFLLETSLSILGGMRSFVSHCVLSSRFHKMLLLILLIPF